MTELTATPARKPLFNFTENQIRQPDCIDRRRPWIFHHELFLTSSSATHRDLMMRDAPFQVTRLTLPALESVVGSIRRVSQVPDAPPEVKSYYDGTTRTLWLVTDQIHPSEALDTFATALYVHFGSEIADELVFDEYRLFAKALLDPAARRSHLPRQNLDMPGYVPSFWNRRGRTITWWRYGVAEKGEPNYIERIQEYASNAERNAAFQAFISPRFQSIEEIPSEEPSHANDNPFVTTESVHRAQVSYFWTDDKLHDHDYKIKVYDAVDAAVKKAEQQHSVTQNTCFKCQWEGIEFEGATLESVSAAANDVAKVLARFKGIKPLSL